MLRGMEVPSIKKSIEVLSIWNYKDIDYVITYV